MSASSLFSAQSTVIPVALIGLHSSTVEPCPGEAYPPMQRSVVGWPAGDRAMAESRVTQRVAAILGADAVGYTRLMADDEPATMDALDAARAVFVEHIEDNQGRVVDTAGDSVLAVFDTTAGSHRGLTQGG